MSSFEMKTVVFHFDSFNYGRRIATIVFLIISILTQMLGEVSGASSYLFFHNLQSNENQRNITLSEQFQNSIEIL